VIARCLNESPRNNHRNTLNMASDKDANAETLGQIERLLRQSALSSGSGSRSSAQSQEVKFKLTYNGEARVCNITRPVQYDELLMKIKEYFGSFKDIFVSPQHQGQLMMRITDQDDLNNALAKWNGQGSVKLVLKDSNQKLSGADSVS